MIQLLMPQGALPATRGSTRIFGMGPLTVQFILRPLPDWLLASAQVVFVGPAPGGVGWQAQSTNTTRQIVNQRNLICCSFRDGRQHGTRSKQFSILHLRFFISHFGSWQ